jgi:hypothetical protein
MENNELTELPKEWYVRVTEDNIKQLITWRNQGYKSLSDKAIGGYLCYNKIWAKNVSLPPLVEISFEQFKKWVLKEIPSFYIKYSSEFTEDLFNKFFEWARVNIEKYEIDYVPISYNDFIDSIFSYIWIDTKTLGTYKYAQDNNPQQTKIEYNIEQLKSLIGYVEKNIQPSENIKIEPWSIDTYVVITDDYNTVNIGEVHKICDSIDDSVNISKSVGRACLPFKSCVKWFATLKEAEEFSKTLTKPEFKSERFVETMEFFNQLQEPYKSQAIANYDEEYDSIVPRTLYEAITYGFEWEGTNEGHDYWESFRESLNTPFSSQSGLGIDSHIYGKSFYDNRGVKDFIENSTKTEPKLLKIDFKSKTIVKEEKLSSIIKLVKPKQILKIK